MWWLKKYSKQWNWGHSSQEILQKQSHASMYNFVNSYLEENYFLQTYMYTLSFIFSSNSVYIHSIHFTSFNSPTQKKHFTFSNIVQFS